MRHFDTPDEAESYIRTLYTGRLACQRIGENIGYRKRDKDGKPCSGILCIVGPKPKSVKARDVVADWPRRGSTSKPYPAVVLDFQLHKSLGRFCDEVADELYHLEQNEMVERYRRTLRFGEVGIRPATAADVMEETLKLIYATAPFMPPDYSAPWFTQPLTKIFGFPDSWMAYPLMSYAGMPRPEMETAKFEPADPNRAADVTSSEMANRLNDTLNAMDSYLARYPKYFDVPYEWQEMAKAIASGPPPVPEDAIAYANRLREQADAACGVDPQQERVSASDIRRVFPASCNPPVHLDEYLRPMSHPDPEEPGIRTVTGAATDIRTRYGYCPACGNRVVYFFDTKVMRHEDAQIQCLLNYDCWPFTMGDAAESSACPKDQPECGHVISPTTICCQDKGHDGHHSNWDFAKGAPR